jgi:hypothetical protein
MMTYLFWSPMETIIFFRCSWLIDIKNLLEVSIMILLSKEE